jgi:hypothetical protein
VDASSRPVTRAAHLASARYHELQSVRVDGAGGGRGSRSEEATVVADVFFALAIGAILMIGGGLVEIVYGVKAERKGLEGIATRPTAVQSATTAGRNCDSLRPRLLVASQPRLIAQPALRT